MGAWCFGCLSGPSGIAFSFAPVLGYVCCWVHVFALSSFLCLDLCVLGDDALMGCFFLMRARPMCFLVHIWARVGGVGAPMDRFGPSSKIFY